MKQGTLSKFRIGDSRSSHMVKTKGLDMIAIDKMFGDSRWTRVKPREMMEQNNDTLYPFKEDFLDLS